MTCSPSRSWRQCWPGVQDPGVLIPMAQLFLPQHLSPLDSSSALFSVLPFLVSLPGLQGDAIAWFSFHLSICFSVSFPALCFSSGFLAWGVVFGLCPLPSLVPKAAYLFWGLGLSSSSERLPLLFSRLLQEPCLSGLPSSSHVPELCCGGAAIRKVPSAVNPSQFPNVCLWRT